MDQSEKNTKTQVENADADTVRGSGFTYDEDKERTDKSIPLEKAEEDDIVESPNLGKPNRP